MCVHIIAQVYPTMFCNGLLLTVEDIDNYMLLSLLSFFSIRLHM